MFAVIKTGGKQYKVSSNDVLRVEKLAAEEGAAVQFNDVLMVGGDGAPTVGAPLVDGAGVQAEVIAQIKGEKVISFKKRRRKHSSKRRIGHRQELTLVRIGDILTSGADKSGVAAAVVAGGVGTWLLISGGDDEEQNPNTAASVRVGSSVDRHGGRITATLNF